MTKIYVYVGLNVCDLKSHTMVGRNVKHGLSDDGLIISVGDTFRKLPEKNLHPKKYAEFLRREIAYCADNWNLHITTNSELTLSLIGEMVANGTISSDNIDILLLDEENKTIETVAGYNELGYLTGWPADFFEY